MDKRAFDCPGKNRRPNHEMATLRAFLDSRRVTKEQEWNITGMSNDDKGKYYVSNTDYDTFHTLYSQHVFQCRESSSLLERHGTHTPLLIDLDFRYVDGTKDRPFEKRSIVQFVLKYMSAFYHFFDYDKPLRFFVMVKPEMLTDKGVVKDGIHIICGDVTLEYTIPFVLRKYTLDQGILGCFPDRINTDEDTFDESVIQRNNWFMYGASKPDKESYAVDYCFMGYPDGRVEECEWIETDAEFIRLFSLQMGRDDPTPLTVRPDVLDEWNTWESIACNGGSSGGGGGKKSVKKVFKADAEPKEDGSVCSHLSDGITKILKLKGVTWEVSECEEGYKLAHNTTNCLVMDSVNHSTLGHSCVFVQRTHATMSCFSHKTKKIPRGKAEALWRLLTAEEDDGSDLVESYAKRKAAFELLHFRVLNPPGYMTFIEDGWIHYTRQQLIDMNSGSFLDGAKKERFIDWWLRDEGIRTYSRIGYYVDASECASSVFNIFRGFDGSRMEGAGSIDLLLYHMRTVISNGCEDVYEFLLDWLASCIQCPRRLTGICLVIMGQHGSGKDILFNWFGSKVVGMDAYFKTARPHIDMFGAFNASRINRVLYHIEEGNRNSMTAEYIEQFKNCVTDEFAAVQLKGKDTRDNVINYNHFVITTNNSVPFDIHHEERRIFAVRSNPLHVRDAAYFDRLDKECLRVPGVARAFYDYLMARDLTTRDWKNPPATEALKEWKHTCESVIVQFIEYFRTMNPEVVEMLSSELYAEYKNYCREFKSDVMTLRAFGMEVKKVVGESVHTRTGKVYTFEKPV